MKSSRALATSTAAMGAAALLAAGASAGVTSARSRASAKVAAARAIPRFTFKAPKLNLSRVRGKAIFNIPLSTEIPYEVAIDTQAAALAKAHGVKWIEFPNQGTPTQYATGINQAIQRHASLIILAQGVNPELVIPQLQKARRAHIPVLVTHNYGLGAPVPRSVRHLVSAVVNAPFSRAGGLEVDYAVSKVGCNLHPLIITSSDVPASAFVYSGMTSQLRSLCPKVTPTRINVTVPEWGTKIQPDVQAQLDRAPNTNWIFAVFDSMTIPANAGVLAAGKSAHVRIVGYNGTPAVLKFLEKGSSITADIGENTNWLAYATMDQAFRLLGAGPVVKSGNGGTPLRVLDATNIRQTGTPPTFTKGYGRAYVSGYRRLWSGKHK